MLDGACLFPGGGGNKGAAEIWLAHKALVSTEPRQNAKKAPQLTDPLHGLLVSSLLTEPGVPGRAPTTTSEHESQFDITGVESNVVPNSLNQVVIVSDPTRLPSNDLDHTEHTTPIAHITVHIADQGRVECLCEDEHISPSHAVIESSFLPSAEVVVPQALNSQPQTVSFGDVQEPRTPVHAVEAVSSSEVCPTSVVLPAVVPVVAQSSALLHLELNTEVSPQLHSQPQTELSSLEALSPNGGDGDLNLCLSQSRTTFNSHCDSVHLAAAIDDVSITTETTHNSNSESELATSAGDEMEAFLQSVSHPIPSPLLQPLPTPLPALQSAHNPPPCSSQRKSIRLAMKAAANPGKDTMQLAQDLLIKKLGESATDNDEHEKSDPGFEFYAQHFERPLEMPKMEALQYLIENGTKKQKKHVNLVGGVSDSAVEA